MEQSNIAERLQKAVADTTYSKKRSPLFFALLILLIALVGYDVYLRYKKIPALQTENRNLKYNSFELKGKLEHMINKEEENIALLTTLRTQLAPFQKAARQRYPEEKAALAKLHEDITKQEAEIIGLGEMSGQQKKKIRTLQRASDKQKKEISELKAHVADLEDQLQFREVATWTFEGQNKLWNGQFIDTPVAGWIDKYKRKSDDGTAQWDCGSVALFHYREVMETYPTFPFTYYVLAHCLKMKGEVSWEKYAKEGIAILKKTTNIANHGKDHDDTLAELHNLLDTP